MHSGDCTNKLKLATTYQSFLHLQAEDDDVSEFTEVLADISSQIRVLVDMLKGIVVESVLALRVSCRARQGDRLGHQAADSTDILFQGLVNLQNYTER